MKKRAGINTLRHQWSYVYGPEARKSLGELLELDETVVPEGGRWNEFARSVEGAEIVLSTWRAHPFTKELLDRSPNLELVIYAAGSVKPIVTEELINRGIKVCSAVHLNAQPVAEFTLGIILMALKSVFALNDRFHETGPPAWSVDLEHFPGGYFRSRVGLLGYGRVTEQLLRLLKNFEMEILLSDPYLGEEQIRSMGATPATLEEIMSSCDVVSLHHGNTPQNREMINSANLALLKSGSAR